DRTSSDLPAVVVHHGGCAPAAVDQTRHVDVPHFPGASVAVRGDHAVRGLGDRRLAALTDARIDRRLADLPAIRAVDRRPQTHASVRAIRRARVRRPSVQPYHPSPEPGTWNNEPKPSWVL